MQALFKCEKAMTAYARVFSRKTAPDGYRIRLEDATLDIEAIYRQRAIDRDNCDANGEGQQSFDE